MLAALFNVIINNFCFYLDYIAYGAYTGELGLTWPQAGVASVFLQALRGGAPKILYAPNGTAADSIIDKVIRVIFY